MSYPGIQTLLPFESLDIPVVAHDLFPVLKSLTDIPFLRSLEAMLATWPRPVQVHLPDVADEASSIDANPADAMKCFANKMALLFNNVDTQNDELKIWLDGIRSDLGLPRMTLGRCMVYATPDGKGTAAHFDQNINFVLQLFGTKTWWLAENQNVINATRRHTIGQPLDPELTTYLSSPMPLAMPEQKTKIVLKPGSMLFVPRGYWHCTEAAGDAMSLNFTFDQPGWADLFLAALRSRLLLSPEWRALASPANPEELDELLSGLVEDLPNWRAEDILGATEG